MSSIAEKLGQTPHLSPLLRKVRTLGLADPEDLRKIAVKRGCSHYVRPDDNLSVVKDPGREQLPDIDLAFAMLSGGQTFDTRRIRAAVQLLSGAEVSPAEIVRRAKMERCEALIRQVAEAGVKFDNERTGFWRGILCGVASVAMPPEGRLPHPSRYYLETGFSRPGGKPGRKRVWLRQQGEIESK